MKQAEHSPRLLSELVYLYADLADQLESENEGQDVDWIKRLMSADMQGAIERHVRKLRETRREIEALNNPLEA